MTPAYESSAAERWQPGSDRSVALGAAAAVVGAWWGWSTPTFALALALAGAAAVAAPRSRSAVTWLVAASVLVAGGVRSDVAWQDATTGSLGEFSGWAVLAADPQPVGRGLRVVVELEGERFVATTYGSPRRRLARRQAGELIELTGERNPLDPAFARRWQARHVVGELEVTWVGGHRVGSPVARASNRVRALLRTSAEATMPPAEAALFTGLVIGDDARQTPDVVEQFRSSGLSHLTAVSGQNVT